MASAFPRHPFSFNPSFIFWLRLLLSSCPDPLSLWQPSLLGAFALLGLDQRVVLFIPLQEEQASPPSWALGQVAPPASPFAVTTCGWLLVLRLYLSRSRVSEQLPSRLRPVQLMPLLSSHAMCRPRLRVRG